MKRKILCMLLAPVMVLMLGFSIGVHAAGTVASGTCSDGAIAWTLDENGTMTLTGQGVMEGETVGDVGAENHVYEWDNLRAEIKAVVIGEGITSVGGRAFEECVNLTSVQLPDSLKFVSWEGFLGCVNLASVEFPTANPISIGARAFSRTGLTSLVLPDNVTHLGDYAFSGCTDMISAKLSSGLGEYTRPGLFNGCSSLTSVDFGTGVRFLGQNCFSGAGFTELVLPDTIQTLGDRCFRGCEQLTTLDLGSGVRTVHESAFASCDNLKKVTIGSALERIERNAFHSSEAIEEIHIDDLVSWNNAEVVFKDSSPTYYGYDRLYIEGVLAERVVIPKTLTVVRAHTYGGAASIKTVTVPDHVTSFDGFDGCVNLTHADIGRGVVSMGQRSFIGCTSLKEVVFRGSAPETITPNSMFGRCTANCYYPANDPSWDEKAMYYPTASLTWIAYDPAVGVANPFTDVPISEFYHEPVLWAYENGVTSGLTATEFGPNAVCNRAQVVTFLWRAAGCPEPAVTENPFVDVEPGSFYEKAVLWAVEKGITTGTNATHFSPNMACNRATVVTFLYRAFEEPAVEGTENTFTDVPAESWYTAPVLWAVEQGITNGMGEGIFGSETACNRAQIVTFLYRAYTE